MDAHGNAQRRGEFGQNCLHAGLHRCVVDANFLNQLPLTVTVYEKFRLLAALAIHIVQGILPDRRVYGVPVDLVQVFEVIEPLREGGDAVPV